MVGCDASRLLGVTNTQQTICLCSASESRALLLQKFRIPFVQKVANYDEEQIKTDDAKQFVYTAVQGKMKEAIKLFGLEMPLLCADTVIATKMGEILRKPKNYEDAKRILELQSGSEIAIISAMHYRTKTIEFLDISATHYYFDKFDTDELERYLESGLWQGKAGGCMVEGFCKKYIRSVRGLESTAMGLQVEVLLPWLR